VAWPEPALLAADPEGQRPAEHDSELLVLVAVARDDAVGIELDDGEGDAVPVYRAREHAVPDSDRGQRRQLFERAHPGRLTRENGPVAALSFRERPSDGDPEGLVVLHHGRGADDHDLLPLADALDPARRLHVVTPRAPLSLPGWPGYHWYVVPR